MGKLESYNGVASAILGQSEVFISIKKELPFLSEKRLFTMRDSQSKPEYIRQINLKQGQ